jgi:hypothetical protein
MTSDFETVIERLRVLSALAVAEEGEIRNLTLGEGPHRIDTPEMDDYRSEPRPCKASLLAFLNALPVAQVYALASLMYAGREGEENAIELWSSLKDRIRSKAHAAKSIAQKSPRMSYIDAGILALGEVLPLRELPERIAAA